MFTLVGGGWKTEEMVGFTGANCNNGEEKIVLQIRGGRLLKTSKGLWASMMEGVGGTAGRRALLRKNRSVETRMER